MDRMLIGIQRFISYFNCQGGKKDKIRNDKIVKAGEKIESYANNTKRKIIYL